MKRCSLIGFALLSVLAVTHGGDKIAASVPTAIPWNEIGANAGTDYGGDGLAVTPTKSGARLRCVFQRLDGEATPGGLWLTSTVTNGAGDRFGLMAMAVGRRAAGPSDFRKTIFGTPLAAKGTLSICGQMVRFVRPGLTEEYSVSVDGVRQDFITEQAPPRSPTGELIVKLGVTGAQVEPVGVEARLVLDHSGRQIAYRCLHVSDATGRALPAHIEVCPSGDGWATFASGNDCGKLFGGVNVRAWPASKKDLAVVVNDAGAVYPVRIDPTFSDANWAGMGGLPGMNGTVFAAAVDGSGNLYVGGQFSIAGDVFATNIAKWNGSSWSAVGLGINYFNSYYGAVYALAVSGNTLYAGGEFSTAGNVAAANIAQWNGTNWSALGSGIEGTVYALAVSGSTLYAGGYLGDDYLMGVAQWNGNGWSFVGSGIDGTVEALAVLGGNLYVGGDFSDAIDNDGTVVPAYSIVCWDGSNWSEPGAGFGGFGAGYNSVNALAVLGNTLYAGGDFTLVTNSGGATVKANYMAQWNGTNWSAVGSGMNGAVNALTVSGNALYAAGEFSTAGGGAASNIAKWNGSSWSALGSGLQSNGYLYALAVSGSTLYAGGEIWLAGGETVDSIAKWNGSSWSALGPGLGGPSPSVNALAVSGSTVYAGGSFQMDAGGITANYIEQWNGSSWSALGSGMNGEVLALAASGNTLYAGGYFSEAGGVSLNNIAKWNGSSWSALGSGINGTVYALVVSGSTLYAGGNFSTAGGNAAYSLAQWNGSRWSPVGSGMNSYSDVYALAVSGSTLYAGGDFTTATNSGNAAVPVNYVAQWDGTNWSALGPGLGGSYSYVKALAVSSGTLYAGGYFSTAGGNAATNIAQWNGSDWSALGSGMDTFVNALAATGGTLYAGGEFMTAGGVAVNYIAQWNGSNWSALGSSMNNYVNALTVAGGTLYAGGYFTTAGTNVSDAVAEATVASPPTIFSQPQSTGVMAGSPAGFAVGADGQTLSYQWFKNGNRLLNGGEVSGATSNSLWLTNVSVNDPGYYLVVVTNNWGGVTSSVATLTVSNLSLNLPGGNNLAGFSSNQFWLTVAGPAGSNVMVSASTNLQTWVPLTTNPLSLGTLIVTDILATNYPQRFYRAQVLP